MTAKSKKKRERTLRPPVKLEIPIHDGLDDAEMMIGGFRQEMISVGDPNTEEHGYVMTGAGLGSDVIHMEWRGRKAIVFGRALFKAWVETFAPEDAKRLP